MKKVSKRSTSLTARALLLPLLFTYLLGSRAAATREQQQQQQQRRRRQQATTTTGTNLGGGVVTRTDVRYLADLMLDVRDVDQLIDAGNSDAALTIYVRGKHSLREAQTGDFMALTDLSAELWNGNDGIPGAPPPFLFQLYGLGGRLLPADRTQLLDNSAYADSYLRNTIRSGKSTAAEAAAVLNVWMYAASGLYEEMVLCQKKAEVDNPHQFDNVIPGAGLDAFAALWIGSGQTHGSSEGYSLYALAERADQMFDSTEDDDEGDRSLAESSVNRKLKLLYQEGASLLSIPNVCAKGDADTPKKLWSVITRMNHQMYIPLLQMLIVSVLEKDELGTDLYATAIVPQASQCRPSVYDRLKEELLDGGPSFERPELILRDLQEIYSCFGISCSDIGVFSKNPSGIEIPPCLAAKDDAPMALYRPSTGVHPIATIDLDVLQIRTLTALGSFDYAKFWYLYGRNSPRQRDSENDPHEFYSLHEFAVSSSRRNAEPYYSSFISYHNDPNYADVLVRNTLDGVGKWGSDNSSPEQRAAIITETCSFLVLYLHLLAQINAAVGSCGDDQNRIGEYEMTHPWDEVAALVIGSLEGMEEGGSSDVRDGQMIWGLGSRRGYQFQTLNSRGYASVNSNLEDLLLAGRGEIYATDCAMLKKTAENIKSATLISLMQSVLKYAILNDHHLADSTSADLALGEVFALAIIPIVDMFDPPSAEILEENMVIRPGIKPVRDGVQQIADAIGSAANAMGISPRQIGSTPEANPSLLYGGSSAEALQPCLLSSIAALSAFVTFFL